MSSCHLFLGLPISLLVLYLELRPGIHSAAFFSHLSHGEVAILSANFHFIFLCVLFQHRIFARSILSNASTVLLFMHSIQFSSSISIVSISSSESSSNVTLCALTIAALVISATHFGDVNILLFFFGLNILFFNFLFFLFVWIMSLSILRCVD